MIDYTGLTSTECPNCGDNKFKTWIVVDEEFEIGMYGTDGECWECGTKYSLVTPIDLEKYRKGDV